MAERQKQGDGKSVNKALIIVIASAVVIIAALIGVIIYMSQMRDSNEVRNQEEDKKRPVVVTEDNIEQVVEDVVNREEPQGVPLRYVATMNSTWEFESGDKVSRNAYVANSANNETPVYFDVVRNDTQETIYQSPVIPVGGELTAIELDTDLDAGDYECTLIYHLIDDDQNTLTTVSMWVMVKIEN